MSDNSFNSRLITAICYTTSHLCVGLDPDLKLITPQARYAAERIVKKAQGTVSLPGIGSQPSDAVARVSLSEAIALLTQPYVAAFKPNTAFFEGSRTGLAALEGLNKFLHNLPGKPITICDAKRGDIGNTSARYAEAIFTQWQYDAVTVNPLMGTDSVEPFLQDPERGVFLLCLTSNPGASDFLLKNELYKRIAEQAVKWNTRGNVGLVVGATRAVHAAAVRAIAPELPLLIPGIGAQGGSLAEILDAIDAKNNPRFLINASRTIMAPEMVDGEDYPDAVSAAAQALRDSINHHLRN